MGEKGSIPAASTILCSLCSPSRYGPSASRLDRRLRVLTDDYEVPAEACNTWHALWHGLAALEESLHSHIHLENNILFPRSLSN